MELELARAMAKEFIEQYLSVAALEEFYSKNDFHNIMGYKDDEIVGYLTEDWKFRFNDSRVNCAETVYDKATIYLSKAFVKRASKSTVKDALMHEMAHALCPKEGHNHIWYEISIRIGYVPCEGTLWQLPQKRKRKKTAKDKINRK